eukprot:scaffold2893_cov254-Pinguiococcus_pyrenoidosus.AAC.1
MRRLMDRKAVRMSTVPTAGERRRGHLRGVRWPLIHAGVLRARVPERALRAGELRSCGEDRGVTAGRLLRRW